MDMGCFFVPLAAIYRLSDEEIQLDFIYVCWRNFLRIKKSPPGHIKVVEVITMAKQSNKTAAGTNIQEVRQQNAQAGAAGQFGTEFAAETDVQEVKQQNAQAEARKSQKSSR